ncbi:MAG: glutamine-hydrolyzing GMP synthase [Clostridia bacterium]|nr:glutamine-hydrolyzing GMP synthase [Clostridia bacterium]
MDKILVLDFGGQYNQLIARRVRSEHVFAEIKPYNKITASEIKTIGYKGIIFTGGPNSVYDESSPHVSSDILEAGIPVLGICYGHQVMAYTLGGTVTPGYEKGEYGKTTLYVSDSPLFKNIARMSICWMSHRDMVSKLPDGFKAIAKTDQCDIAAMENPEKRLYGVQFHPEVTHTEYGSEILRNFLFEVCGCGRDWRMEDFIENSVERYRKELSGQKVLLALSGGVDSSVAAMLLHRAIGSNLYCVFVDHGLLRKNEGDYVEKTLGEELGVNIIRVNAKNRFLGKLAGVTEPEKKRKIIGSEFIHVFEEEARKLGRIDALAQGTIYPDVIESGKGDSAVIKSHHNVGGLPSVMDFKMIVEPLRELFKDEVREVGVKLGIPADLVFRQPFPGPGLAVRIIGEITDEKLDLLKDADAIFREELDRTAERPSVAQYFAVLLDTRSVGVMGDSRTYGYTVALRAVKTDDFMTAEWARIPFEVLERASNRITNEIKGITRVVYDITSKPPATVEWE